MTREFIAAADAGTLRIDRYLSDLCPELSRSHLQKLIKDGAVLVNGGAIKSNYRVAAGDRIEFEVPEPVAAVIAAEAMELDIPYEDEDLLIVNKPKGMVVHPAPGHDSQTLANALMFHCRDGLSGINGVLRPGIVHRIDRDTTGLLIVCKNDIAHNRIAEQLKEHTVTRKYTALVHGVVKAEEGTVNAPIGRHPTDRVKMAINHKHGKTAVTHYRVLERFQKYTLLECQLETGRTHQIRVHMASLGHPLLGDVVYGPQKCPYKLQGQTLHAGMIGFVHPRAAAYMEFQAPLPEYFQDLLKELADH